MEGVRILYACRARDGDYYEGHRVSIEEVRACTFVRVMRPEELCREMAGNYDLVIVFGDGWHFVDAIREALDAGAQAPVLYLYTVHVPEIPEVESVGCTYPSEIGAAVERLLETAR